MKKFLTITVGVLIIGGLWWLLGHRVYDIKNDPPNGSTIIAFGDSLVVGVGSTEGNDFVSLLSKKLNVPIINAGHSGDTTEEAIVRLSDDVLSHDPAIVMVLLGGNDFLKRVSKQKMIANLRHIIEATQGTGSMVVLLGIRGGIIADGYESDLRALARDTGSVYVPNVLEGLFGDSKYMDDAIHPNDAGYEIIAARIKPVLAELIN